MFLVSRTTPPLAALYELPPAVPSRPSMLATVTKEPRSPSTRGCSIILARAAFATRNVPVRLIPITRSHSARSSRWTGPPPATPAAWTTPSRRSGTAASMAATAASSVISAVTNVNPGPRSGARVRSAPTTVPPSASRRRAVARPMPDAAPVTTNVRDSARLPLTMPRPYALHHERRDGGGLVDRQVHQHRRGEAARPRVQPAEEPARNAGDQHGADDGLSGDARIHDVPQPERRGLQQPAAGGSELLFGEGAQRRAVGGLLGPHRSDRDAHEQPAARMLGQVALRHRLAHRRQRRNRGNTERRRRARGQAVAHARPQRRRAQSER